MHRLACLLFAAMAGCAQLPAGFELTADTPGSRPAWPSVDSGESPRYERLGQLTGESNFRAASTPTSGALSSALRWLVGLGGGRERRDVLQRPQSVLVDAQGRVFVTDVSRRDLLVFDPGSTRLAIWPSDRTPPDGWLPIGLASGVDGTLLVTDAEGGVVHRFDRDGRYAGRFGAGVLRRPTGIARNPEAGRTYVADTRAHDIKVFDDQGSLLGTLGGPGEAPGSLNAPTALTWARGRLYVTDTMNARVQVFDDQGRALQTIGRRGHYVGNFAHPKGLAVDSEGNVYVTESRHDRLLVFAPDGQFALSIGDTGADSRSFYLPAGLWVDALDRVWVADMFNGRVSVLQYLGGRGD